MAPPSAPAKTGTCTERDPFFQRFLPAGATGEMCNYPLSCFSTSIVPRHLFLGGKSLALSSSDAFFDRPSRFRRDTLFVRVIVLSRIFGGPLIIRSLFCF